MFDVLERSFLSFFFFFFAETPVMLFVCVSARECAYVLFTIRESRLVLLQSLRCTWRRCRLSHISPALREPTCITEVRRFYASHYSRTCRTHVRE